MDFSVTSQLTSKMPEKVSTEEIKAGLERIKKAQEQVLKELKRNHPDESIDVRLAHSQIYLQKKEENENLRRELNIEREKSGEKSTLYRRRVVDLESSLAHHTQKEEQYEAQIKTLLHKLEALQAEHKDLEADYGKLISESEKSNKNLRALEKQIMDLNVKLQSGNPLELQSRLETLSRERNTIMSEKIALLKTNSKLESENIELKSRLSEGSGEKQKSYSTESVNFLLNEITKINSSHEFLFNALKSNRKLNAGEVEKENGYQNGLNKILGLLGSMQKNGESAENEYKFDNEKSFREEHHKIQNDLIKKHKKELVKSSVEKGELLTRNKSLEVRNEELLNENQELEEKLNEIRKEKNEYLEEINTLTGQVTSLRQNQEKEDKDRIQEQIKKEKNKDIEYRTIIGELNEQMVTIQKQKRDLDGLIGTLTNNRSEDDLKNKKKLNEILEVNQKIREENEKIKEKYEAILIEKEHLYLSLNDSQNKNTNLGKELAKEVLTKEKLVTDLNKIRQEKELQLVELRKFSLLYENVKIESENTSYGYLQEIERITQESLQLRNEIEYLLKDRNELRDLKGKYSLLMKDNQILGKKAKISTDQIDHLWMIKEVEYQNLNKVMESLKPM